MKLKYKLKAKYKYMNKWGDTVTLATDEFCRDDSYYEWHCSMQKYLNDTLLITYAGFGAN
jgi:hypothetical protein